MVRHLKNPMVKVIGLKDLLKTKGLTTKDLSNHIEIDIKYAYKIIAGATGLALPVALKLTELLGPIQLEMNGLKFELRQPDTLSVLPEFDSDLTAGEMGWILAEEYDEAQEHIKELRLAIKQRDIPKIIHLYEQIICDPIHATQGMAEAFTRELGPLANEIVHAAWKHHHKKVADKYSESEAA